MVAPLALAGAAAAPMMFGAVVDRTTEEPDSEDIAKALAITEADADVEPDGPGTDVDVEDSTVDESATDTEEPATGDKADTSGSDVDVEDSTMDESAIDAEESGSILRRVAIGGVGGVLVEVARRLGIDRYAESGLAEQFHAEAVSRQVDGAVVEEGLNVFAPDGGVDKRILVETSEEITVQSKHYGEPLPESVVREYADKVDVIASTNGTAEGVDPANYGLEEISKQDWPWRSRLRLELNRIVRGAKRGFGWIARRLSSAVDLARAAITRGSSAARSIVTFVASAIRSATSRFVAMTLGRQLLVVLGIAGVGYLLWRWYQGESGLELDISLPTR